MNYQVCKERIFSDNGLVYGPRWFCDGRVSFRADNNEIIGIEYFGEKTTGHSNVFLKQLWSGMRLYTVTDNERHMLTANKCEITPFGFSSETTYANHRIFAVDDYIIFVVRPKFDCNIALEFYDDSLFKPLSDPNADFRLIGKPRQWKPITVENGTISFGYIEEDANVNLCFSSDLALSYKKRVRNPKNIITAADAKAGKEYMIALHFSCGENKINPDWRILLEKQEKRYSAVAERAPVLKSEHKLLNQFFALAPIYHESLKTVDVKGGVRAQSTHYWVWGWDSLTSCDPYFYWGDIEFAGQMLSCMENSADEKYGLAHRFERDMTLASESPPSAQSFYLVMLNNYRLAGGDYKKYYPFAKKLFNMVIETCVGDLGLLKGTSLYPDFRDVLHETDNDISTFNNTVGFCGIRAFEQTARAFGDTESAHTAARVADKIKENFEKIMFDSKVGFIDASVDATTLEHRNVSTNNAIKWENNACAELISQHKAEYLDFYINNIVSPAGLRAIPSWADGYDADSNQLSCWWPVMSEFYIRLINNFDKKELIDKYIGWVEYWSERLMCPEGIPCYNDDPNVPFDNWNCMTGIWQAYSVRGFYNAILHGFVGIDFDDNGILFYPYSGEEVSVSNLHFGKYTFDISILGSGRNIAEVTLNGAKLGCVKNIPFEKLEEKNRIVVVRVGD